MSYKKRKITPDENSEVLKTYDVVIEKSINDYGVEESRRILKERTSSPYADMSANDFRLSAVLSADASSFLRGSYTIAGNSLDAADVVNSHLDYLDELTKNN